jgi:hypothetical protein
VIDSLVGRKLKEERFDYPDHLQELQTKLASCLAAKQERENAQQSQHTPPIVNNPMGSQEIACDQNLATQQNWDFDSQFDLELDSIHDGLYSFADIGQGIRRIVKVEDDNVHASGVSESQFGAESDGPEYANVHFQIHLASLTSKLELDIPAGMNYDLVVRLLEKTLDEIKSGGKSRSTMNNPQRTTR